MLRMCYGNIFFRKYGVLTNISLSKQSSKPKATSLCPSVSLIAFSADTTMKFDEIFRYLTLGQSSISEVRRSPVEAAVHILCSRSSVKRLPQRLRRCSIWNKRRIKAYGSPDGPIGDSYLRILQVTKCRFHVVEHNGVVPCQLAGDTSPASAHSLQLDALPPVE